MSEEPYIFEFSIPKGLELIKEDIKEIALSVNDHLRIMMGAFDDEEMNPRNSYVKARGLLNKIESYLNTYDRIKKFGAVFKVKKPRVKKG